MSIRKKSIYLMYYSRGSEAMYMPGQITRIKENNIYFTTTSSEEARSGPIMNLSNYKVTGIYNGEMGLNNSKRGIFILDSINNFNENEKSFNSLIQEIDDTNSDEIKIIYDVYNSNKKKQIKIFGDKFVENNNKICEIINNGKTQELSTKIDINKVK